MDRIDLSKIIVLHAKWLCGEKGGIRANLRDAHLTNADLGDADLRGANLKSANLIGADLISADLRGADLRGANLRDANLRGANLIGANLISADLTNADLRDADLTNADLTNADLRGANLRNAHFNAATLGLHLACPEEGAFTAYKKASGKIVVLEIPAEARRSSATTKKCRCDKAKVVRLEELDGTVSDTTSVSSDRDSNFIYEVGKMAVVNNFDNNRWNECSAGIHFFINKEIARQYN